MEPVIQESVTEHQFDAVFEIKIQSIRTASVGALTNVVKHVGFIVKGSLDGQGFELPQAVELGDPDPASFKEIGSLAESDVIAWVEENFKNMHGVKWHIETQLKRLVAEAALESKPLPWAPEAQVPANSSPLPQN